MFSWEGCKVVPHFSKYKSMMGWTAGHIHIARIPLTLGRKLDAEVLKYL